MHYNNYTEVEKRNPFKAVMYSNYKVRLAFRGQQKKYSNYWFNLFYFLDVWLNAMTGGHPDVTVSGRTGYYNDVYSHRCATVRLYWKLMMWIIDTTFKPIDGPNHCIEAYKMHRQEFDNMSGESGSYIVKIDRGRLWFLMALLFISSLVCILIAPVLYIFKDSF